MNKSGETDYICSTCFNLVSGTLPVFAYESRIKIANELYNKWNYNFIYNDKPNSKEEIWNELRLNFF